MELVLPLRLYPDQVPFKREASVREKGFTLIELLVVVAIIGIIAAIAIPNMIIAIQRAKQRRTMADMRSIAMAWESRSSDVGRYNAAGGIEDADTQIPSVELSNVLAPTYIKALPTKDGWGNDYAFFSDQAMGVKVPAKTYVIISGGHDGQISPNAFRAGFTDFDCDIIYMQGNFLSYPEGYGLR